MFLNIRVFSHVDEAILVYLSVNPNKSNANIGCLIYAIDRKRKIPQRNPIFLQTSSGGHNVYSNPFFE